VPVAAGRRLRPHANCSGALPLLSSLPAVSPMPCTARAAPGLKTRNRLHAASTAPGLQPTPPPQDHHRGLQAQTSREHCSAPATPYNALQLNLSRHPSQPDANTAAHLQPLTTHYNSIQPDAPQTRRAQQLAAHLFRHTTQMTGGECRRVATALQPGLEATPVHETRQPVPFTRAPRTAATTSTKLNNSCNKPQNTQHGPCSRPANGGKTRRPDHKYSHKSQMVIWVCLRIEQKRGKSVPCKTRGASTGTGVRLVSRSPMYCRHV
jgi:hypothetical protein